MTFSLPIRAAIEVATAHGVVSDRCEVLQNGSTLVLRLSETVVVRVVQDKSGPRKGKEWFERENSVAQYLTQQNAPIIPLHPAFPAEPHEHLGYLMNFWFFVTQINDEPSAVTIAETLKECHEKLRGYKEPLPSLAILVESASILEHQQFFSDDIKSLLQSHLATAINFLNQVRHQPLHGDAHSGNFMNTNKGLLLTDWEDTFHGPVEWDIASVIWNMKILDQDQTSVNKLLETYGAVDQVALHHSLIARAAVMSIWYPILYPNPDEERRKKLKSRIEWLKER